MHTFKETRVLASTVEQALNFIPAVDREIWIHCGMAIKSELGETGFDIWDRWSANADNYQARDAAAVWRSLKASGGVAIGTLFHIARQHGYRCDNSHEPLPPTAEEVARRETKRKADADLLISQRKGASDNGALIWSRNPSVPDTLQPAFVHRYLKIKGIQVHGARICHGNMVIGSMDCNGALMLPMWLNGKITSLQFINRNGEKRFLPNGEKGGYLIGKIEKGTPVYMCEGFATGASIREATGCAVLVAFDAGNLEKMARTLKAKHPEIDIVVCADDDTTGMGQRKATEAARAVGGRVAMPEFDEPRLTGCKDFNDMATLWGLDKVKMAIDSAKSVEPQTEAAGLRIGDSVRVGNTQMCTEKPEPLPALPDVMPFSYSYLPSALADYVQDISERMQCPPDFAAIAALVMMGSIIGRKVGIRPMCKNDWTVTPNLWGIAVGNSGVMKSPTLAAVLAPIKKLQTAAYAGYEQAKREFEGQDELNKVKQSVNKMEARKTLKGDKNADVSKLLQSTINGDPVLKRYITNNASYEALGEVLMENPNGMMVESDEIIGLLKQLDANGQEVARSFYLTAADGDKPYTFDRITRGKALHIDALCLSIIGGVQPGVLAEYVRQATGGGAGADGLLQRFGLMVYPDISPKWIEVDRCPDSTARKEVDALVERLNNLNPYGISAEKDEYGGVPFLHFDDAAQEVFSAWRAALEHRLRSGEEHPAIVSHLAKYRKLIPSLALINHLCDTDEGPVNEMALQRAIAFGDYLESHMRRIYSYATRPDIDAAKTLLKRLESGKLDSCFKARDLYQKGWTGLETSNKAQAAINLLLEYGHLSQQEILTGGRPTTQYRWIEMGFDENAAGTLIPIEEEDTSATPPISNPQKGQKVF